MTKEEGSNKKEKILADARKKYKKLHDESLDARTSFVEDMQCAFNIGTGHWDQADIEERDKDKRPHLTANKLGKFVAHVVNAEKGIPNMDDIIPVDDKGDLQIAQIYNVIINDIEYRSEAEDIYAMAGEHAVAGGYGYWRIINKYVDDGFDQELEIVKIQNPLMVSLDPRGMYGFIREAIPEEEFENEYPNAEKIDWENYSGFDDDELWWEEDKVFVGEFFKKVPTTKTIVEFQSPTGETGVMEQTDENKQFLQMMEIKRSREVKTHKVMWYKITGDAILEEEEWPGSEIPIIEVSGHEVHLKGKTYKLSLITDAKDMNKMLNYWMTSLTEKVALTPKAPYIADPQQIKGFEGMWQEANAKNHPVLYAKPNAYGYPQRQVPPPIDTGAMAMLQIADSYIDDTLGMYEASKGQASNERSGKAIAARNARSDLGTFSFQDNLRKAKNKTKRMLIDLIPKVYDTDRVIRMRGSDQAVRINENQVIDGKIVKMNDLSVGRYDIRARTFGTPSRRQQAFDNIQGMMQYLGPEIAVKLAPLALNNMDMPGAMEMAQVLQQVAQQPPEEKK